MKILRYLLFPFSIVYNTVTLIRNFFFDKGIFKEMPFTTPIIVVGNLSVGGTGKTPQIEYLIRLLKDRFKVAVLSRGYKRKTKGYVFLNDNHSALDVGDEPLQYFKKFSNIDVAVDGNRVEGATNLITNNSPEVILLDDAYQHRKIKGSFYILLTKYNDLFLDDFLLPTGNLRESRRGAKRADVIIVTKCPSDLSREKQNKIANRFRKYNKKVFFTRIAYGSIQSNQKQYKINQIKHNKVLLITGIAKPKPLLSYLMDNDVDFKHLQFADHHNFSEKEIIYINKEFEGLASIKKIILTTEKDYVRLKDVIPHLYYIEIKSLFLNNNDAFSQLIINNIAQNR